MKYILKPSLEQIAAAKVAVSLWTQKDIWTLIEHTTRLLFADNTRSTWKKVENSVLENVQKLPQPVIIKEKISGIIRPIGLEILKWIEYHCLGNYFCVTLPSQLCWTSLGKVNRERTAEMLIKNENLDIYVRYKLACIYSLQVYVRELWYRIYEDSDEAFSWWEQKKGEVSQQNLVFHWTCEIQDIFAVMNYGTKRPLKRNRSYLSAFEYAADGGIKSSTEFFFEKLSPKERQDHLASVIKRIVVGYHLSNSDTYIAKVDYAGILCFLLSKLEDYEENLIFSNNNLLSQAVVCFLEWPWQSIFMETVSRLWHFFSVNDYLCILLTIIQRIKSGNKDFDYNNLFREFWLKIPKTATKDLLNDYIGILIPELFEIKDEKNITLIFQVLNSNEKHELIFIPRANHICEIFIDSGDLSLLKLFIQECVSSKDTIISFKEKFKRHMICRPKRTGLPTNEIKLEEFCKMLDDFACEYDSKKGVEENDL